MPTKIQIARARARVSVARLTGETLPDEVIERSKIDFQDAEVDRSRETAGQRSTAQETEDVVEDLSDDEDEHGAAFRRPRAGHPASGGLPAIPSMDQVFKDWHVSVPAAAYVVPREERLRLHDFRPTDHIVHSRGGGAEHVLHGRDGRVISRDIVRADGSSSGDRPRVLDEIDFVLEVRAITSDGRSVGLGREDADVAGASDA